MSSAFGPIVRLVNVSKQYDRGQKTLLALRNVSLDVEAGQFVSIMGRSGSGKSTLLNLIAGIDTPSAGTVIVDGHDVSRFSDVQLAQFRRRTVTFIFQFFNLLPTLTARQNVGVPLRADRLPRSEIGERVERALAAVGLTNRADHHPAELSGGEMQRVAIARALATDAQIILADEPTGNLDSAQGDEILELLKSHTERDGRTVILVTHDLRSAAYGDRLITLRDGQVVDEVQAPRATVSFIGPRR